MAPIRKGAARSAPHTARPPPILSLVVPLYNEQLVVGELHRRLQTLLDTLGLSAEVVTADILTADIAQWPATQFDAILLDAPCSSTGTIRRHPDVPWRKQPDDIATLAVLQRALLARAVELVRPGGVLVYCVCSLEPEESSAIIADLLAGDSRFRRRPIAAAELDDIEDIITPEGDLRTLPCGLADPEPRMAGLDGFFAARIERI